MIHIDYYQYILYIYIKQKSPSGNVMGSNVSGGMDIAMCVSDRGGYPLL